MQFSVNVHITDPYASPNEVAHEYKLTLLEKPMSGYDAIIVSVAHDEYKKLNAKYFKTLFNGTAILMDLKGLYNPADLQEFEYWRL